MRYVHPATEVTRYMAEKAGLRLRSDVERDIARDVALDKQRELSRERYGSLGVKDLLKRRNALRAIKFSEGLLTDALVIACFMERGSDREAIQF